MAVDWGIADPSKGFDYLQSLQSIGQSQAQSLQNQTNQYKLRQQQRQDELRPAIAARLGQNDYAGAQQQAVSVGADDLANTIGGLHDQHFKDLSAQNEAYGTTAYTLAQIKDPQQRAQAYAAAVPHLKALGISDQELANPDLSDASLQQHIAQAQGIDSIIKQKQQEREAAQRDRELGQGDQRIDLARQGQTLDEQKFAFEKTKPVSAGYGTSLIDPSTGRVVYDGSGGLAGGGGGDTSRLINSDAGGGQVPDSVQTLGQFVQFGKGLNAKGAKSSSAGTYQINGTTMAEFAPRALGANWQTQPFNADSQEKVGEAIFNWAKQQPNPAAALRGRWVSLSPAAAAQAVAGSWSQARGTIAQGESGGGSGGSAGGLSAQAIDLAARQGIANGGTVPAGYSRNRAAQAAITNRMAQLAQGQDVNGIIQAGQDTKSQGSAFKTWNSGRPNTGAAQVRSLGVAVDHLDQLGQAATALGNGNTPIFNRISQAYAQQTGKAAPNNFGAVKDFVLDEVTKAIIGAGGGVGDREKASQIVANWSSPAQSNGAIKQLQGLMAGQLHGLSAQYQQTTGRQDFERYVSPRAKQVLESHGGSGGGGSIPTLSPEQARAAAPGTRFRTADGRVMTRR